MIEQNVHKALSMAHRAYVIERGHVVMEGTSPELLNGQELKTAYLGL
ncbi:unnamed protein product [marine sediment metagenome]|uniref:Branched-chain amino acid ATP-binding cassette transporter C-terminal domain-containing protein n=1 Tax=marine sediment metagenome TaxID=412755 RepID=X1T504_9ZZZZ